MHTIGLPQRRRLGLAPTTAVPARAAYVGGLAVILARISAIPWTTDPAALERVLAHLKAEVDIEGGHSR